MMVEIVQNKAVTTSRQVSEYFEREHKHVLDSIKDIISSLGVAENSADLFIKTTYIHEQNKQQYPEYIMNRDGFSLLAMGFTGEKATKWKLKYINAFNKMEEYIKKIEMEKQRTAIERAKTTAIRNILTDTINRKVPESDNKKFLYPNYTKLIYKVALGIDINKLRDQLKINKKENIRNFLNYEQLQSVQQTEMIICSLIGIGWGYAQIKKFVENNNTQQIAS